jgi:hypothetical protein
VGGLDWSLFPQPSLGLHTNLADLNTVFSDQDTLNAEGTRALAQLLMELQEKRDAARFGINIDLVLVELKSLVTH